MSPCDADAPLIAMGDQAVESCAGGAIDVAGDGSLGFPGPGVTRTVDLPRAQASVAIVDRAVAARFGVAAVRSGGDEGYIGVAGESIVPRVQTAAASVHVGAGVRLSGGLIDDMWVVHAERAWGWSAIDRPMAQQTGWFDRSDLGLGATWTAPYHRFEAGVQLTSGEGLARRERNDGKDIAGWLIARPLDDPGLEIAVFGREGSRGLGSARNHRLGARVTVADDDVWNAGVEVDKAWGVDGDPVRVPVGASAWFVGHPVERLVAIARVDAIAEAPGDADANRLVGTAAGGVEWPESALTGRVVAGATVGAVGPNARAIAGSPAEAVWARVFVVIEVTGAAYKPLGSAPARAEQPVPPPPLPSPVSTPVPTP